MELPVIDGGILDRQHHYLIKLLERYEGAKVSQLEVAAGAKALLLFAMEHFYTEEKLIGMRVILRWIDIMICIVILGLYVRIW